MLRKAIGRLGWLLMSLPTGINEPNDWLLRYGPYRLGVKLTDWALPEQWGELFVDGAGQVIRVHKRNTDCEVSCCIHNPSDHPLRDARLVWRTAGPLDIKPSHMERICEHGVGHPDHDSLAYLERIGDHDLHDALAVHGCDGCCTERREA